MIKTKINKNFGKNALDWFKYNNTPVSFNQQETIVTCTICLDNKCTNI